MLLLEVILTRLTAVCWRRGSTHCFSLKSLELADVKTSRVVTSTKKECLRKVSTSVGIHISQSQVSLLICREKTDFQVRASIIFIVPGPESSRRRQAHMVHFLRVYWLEAPSLTHIRLDHVNCSIYSHSSTLHSVRRRYFPRYGRSSAVRSCAKRIECSSKIVALNVPVGLVVVVWPSKTKIKP